MAKLILANEEDGIIDDGLHFYPIPTDCRDELFKIEDSIYHKLYITTNMIFGDYFKTVGSWCKKPKGTFHKDLDMCSILHYDRIEEILTKLNTKIFYYKGLSTWSFAVKDYNDIPRKIDIFNVNDLDFSIKAYGNPNYDETEWPSWSRNMLLNAVAKVKYVDAEFTGRFIPYRGLCAYDKERVNYIVTDDWETMLRTLNFKSVDRTEDILENIKIKWNDSEKAKILKIISNDKKLMNHLEENGKRLADIERSIN